MWQDEQNEKEYYDFCRVIDGINIVQLKIDTIHAVTRAMKAIGKDEEPAAKKLKLVVKKVSGPN